MLYSALTTYNNVVRIIYNSMFESIVNKSVATTYANAITEEIKH